MSDTEVTQIDLEQGLVCDNCGVNLRGQALAAGIMKKYYFKGNFNEFVRLRSAKKLKLLEINTAGLLSPFLALLPNRTLVEYPEVNIENLELTTGYWDLVVTSDTLEHIRDPEKALREVSRLLRPGGSKIYTVPLLPSRLSQNRFNKENSYHGDPALKLPDYLVHWEYGADVWVMPLKAGYSSVEILSLSYPNGLALIAHK